MKIDCHKTNARMKRVCANIGETLRNNKWTVFWTIIIGIVVYGSFVFNYTIGIDSDVYISDPNYFVRNWNFQEGRFGISLIDILLFRLVGINTIARRVIALIFLVFACILWCCVIKLYDHRDQGAGIWNKCALFFFIMVYMCSTVWMETLYFTFMAAQCFIGFAMMPIAAVLMWEGIRNNDILLECGSVIILTVGAASYQMMFALFFAGIMMIYLLEYDSKRIEYEEQWSILKKIILFTVLAVGLYFILNILVSRVIFGIRFSNDILSMAGGTDVGLKKKLRRILFTLYRILIGNNYITDKVYASVANSNGESIIGTLLSDKTSDLIATGWIGNILFLVALIVFLIKMVSYRKKRSFAYYLVVLAFLFSTIVICIVGSGGASDRYLHAVPLVTAYLVYDMIFTLKIWNRKLIIVGVVISLVYTCRQMWSSSMLMDSAIRVYQNEQNICQIINNGIMDAWNEKGIDYSNDNEDNPILVIGDYDFCNSEDYINNGIIGVAATTYGSGKFKIESTLRFVPFMRALNYNYKGIEDDDYRLDSLREYAKDMACYPNKGYIQVVNGVTIVKLSDSVYVEDSTN